MDTILETITAGAVPGQCVAYPSGSSPWNGAEVKGREQLEEWSGDNPTTSAEVKADMFVELVLGPTTTMVASEGIPTPAESTDKANFLVGHYGEFGPVACLMSD